MTEQANDVAQQAAPQAADLELQKRITDHLQAKAAMLNELIQLYSALTQKVAAFEAPVHIKAIGLQHFDTGFLWIKEAIQVAPIPAKVEVPPAQAEPVIDAA